jgi:nucleotide-binding universal stress UspA family protein
MEVPMALPLPTILLALDPMAPCRTVAEQARELARCLKARVVACTVLEALEALVELNLPYLRYDELLPAEEEKARSVLQECVTEVLKGVKKVEVRVCRGRVHREILRLAEELPAQLIVMGTHGERGLERAIYGSPAQRVVQRSKIPVLVVPLEAEGR